jgi:hypothetical protein
MEKEEMEKTERMEKMAGCRLRDDHVSLAG